MRRLSVLFFCGLILFTATVHAEPPVPVADDPKPSTGWAGIGVGIGGFVWTFGQLVTIPFCFADFYPADTNICLGTTAVLASGALAVGITGIAIGTRRHAAYKAWKLRRVQRNRVTLDDVSFGYSSGRGQLQLRIAF